MKPLLVRKPLHIPWTRRRVVVLLMAVPLLSLAAMIATDQAVTAGVATLVSIVVAFFVARRGGTATGRALS